MDKWTVGRITTDLRDRVLELFKGKTCVLGFEKSSEGVDHVHYVYQGPRDSALAKAIQRMVEGKGKSVQWSKELPVDESSRDYAKYHKYTFKGGIAYTIKDGDYVVYGDLDMTDLPAIVKKGTIKTSDVSDKRKDRDWQLTYCNLVPQAVHHRNAHGGESLKEVVRHMMETTKWRPSKWLVQGGVPTFYEEDFLFRIGKRPKQDLSWWTPRSI